MVFALTLAMREERFRRALVPHNWDTEFDDPILLPDGGELVTLRDAVECIRKLPKSLYECERWQVGDQRIRRAR